MSKRILLIRPNHTNDKADDYTTFPLGLGYVAAVLREQGHEVKCIDLKIYDVNYMKVANAVEEFQPDFYGISALSFEFLQVQALATFLKDIVDVPVICGGQIAFHSPEILVRNSDVDVCVVGEGEETITDLVENYDDLASVKGIGYLEGDNYRQTAHRDPISDLDAIPFPAYDLFDFEAYAPLLMHNDVYMSHRNLPKGITEPRQMSVMAGRGCPFPCGYCSRMFTSVRRRSVENVMAEVKMLIENYNINVFAFVDELFFFKQSYIREICAQLKPLGVGWYGNARVDTVNRELLEMAKDSGCITIGMGVESGSDTVLKSMNKKLTRDQIISTLKTALDVGVPVVVNLIVGYPGETKETVWETVDMLKIVGYPGTKLHYFTPYPGSPEYQRCVSEGVIKDEKEYLVSLGRGHSGPYRFRFNFTEMTDDELRDIIPAAARKIMVNYIIHLLLRPKLWFRYLPHKDVMNPIYYFYNQWRRPTNYHKASTRQQVGGAV